MPENRHPRNTTGHFPRGQAHPLPVGRLGLIRWRCAAIGRVFDPGRACQHPVTPWPTGARPGAWI